MDKVTRQCPQTTTFLKRKESRSEVLPLTDQPNALPLGQTGPVTRNRLTVSTFINVQAHTNSGWSPECSANEEQEHSLIHYTPSNTNTTTKDLSRLSVTLTWHACKSKGT